MIAKAKAEPTESEKPKLTMCPLCGAEIVGVVVPGNKRLVCLLHPFDHAIDQENAMEIASYYPPPFLGTRAPVAKKNPRLTRWEKKHKTDWSVVEEIDDNGYRVIQARYSPPDSQPAFKHPETWKVNGNAAYLTRYNKTCAMLREHGLAPKPFDEWVEQVKAAEAQT